MNKLELVYSWSNEVKFSSIIGKTLTSAKIVGDYNDRIQFVTSENEVLEMYHEQDCCENVTIDDIEGDLEDLVGSPILQAEEVSNEEFEKTWETEFSIEDEYGSKINKKGEYLPESYTWTFYKLATIKGYITIRWFGESNGYYSESVGLYWINKPEENE